MKNLIRNKIFRIGIAVVLALGMVVGIALPGLAQDQTRTTATAQKASKPLPNLVRGEVTRIDLAGMTFVVKQGADKEVTVKVDQNTKFYIVPAPKNIIRDIKDKLAPKIQQAPPKVNNGTATLPEKANQKALTARAAKGAVEVKPVPLANGIANQEDKLIPRNAAQATFNDLAVGDKVLVSLAAGDEPRTARLVLITKHKPQVMKTIKGEVMAVGDGKITIKTADSEITLSYDKDTVFTLKGVIAVAPGQQARVTYDSEKMLARRVGIN